MYKYIWLCLKIQYRLFCIYSDPGRGAKRGINSPFPSAYAPQSHAGIVHTATGYLCSGSKTGLCSSFLVLYQIVKQLFEYLMLAQKPADYFYEIPIQIITRELL